MTARITARPTSAELEILQVLWRSGPSTVRAVHEALGADTGYTTVLKLMQIMAEKGLLTRDTNERSHVYHPASAEEQTKKRLVHDFLDKAFRGSAKDLILQALSTRKASREDLAEIRKMIEEIEKGKQ
ncbi:MAG TPA: BlaI/MecI/CopY family transcriptional regulator [Verrucomicrobiae bacterium]|jgi:predicted transcriptional regulator|nr:BlaI/MecI/CopY family transcriptional regulator [Verrucomicrobiae bacterium]